jgi:hypothetical protein
LEPEPVDTDDALDVIAKPKEKTSAKAAMALNHLSRCSSANSDVATHRAAPAQAQRDSAMRHALADDAETVRTAIHEGRR